MKVTNPRSITTMYESDIWGRKFLVDPPIGPEAAYDYDALERLNKVDMGGAGRTIANDYASRIVSMDDADMGEWAYEYNAIGNLTLQTEARGQRIYLYYDNLNRLVGKHYRNDDNCPSDPALDIGNIHDGIFWLDDFEDGIASNDWTARGSVSTSNGQAQVAYPDKYDSHIHGYQCRRAEI